MYLKERGCRALFDFSGLRYSILWPFFFGHSNRLGSVTGGNILTSQVTVSFHSSSRNWLIIS
jgi:hypothetical protein